MFRNSILTVGFFSALATAAKVGEGDLYVFAYSWTPEFCYGEQYPGCSNPEEFWGTHFTLHGLWPQYAAGGYPQDCTTVAYNSSVPVAIGMDTMTQYWPNVQETEGTADYDDFWAHEWTKHGTCSGMTQYDYMNDSINLIKQLGTPADFTAAVGGTIDADQLRDLFGGKTKASLQCESGNYVVGVFTCWDHDSEGHPTTQVDCPSDVQAEDTCSATTLDVASF